MTVTPLDTCAVAMSGKPWQRMQAANHTEGTLVSTLLGSMEVWSPGSSHKNASDVTFDAVATYVSSTLERFHMQEIRLAVTDEGATVRDNKSKLAALSWDWQRHGGLSGFFGDLVHDLIGGTPSEMRV